MFFTSNATVILASATAIAICVSISLSIKKTLKVLTVSFLYFMPFVVLSGLFGEGKFSQILGIKFFTDSIKSSLLMSIKWISISLSSIQILRITNNQILNVKIPKEEVKKSLRKAMLTADISPMLEAIYRYAKEYLIIKLNGNKEVSN